jgi:hypothetical protein
VLVIFYCNRPAVGSTESVEVYQKKKERRSKRRVRVRGIFNIFIATSRQLMAAEGGFMKTWGDAILLPSRKGERQLMN